MTRAPRRLAFLGRLEGLPIGIVLALLYGVFMLTAPEVFTGYRIYMSFFQTVPPMLVVALGLTFVITAGEIDLSFPAVMALSGFVFTWVFKTFQAPWMGFVLAIAAGALVGYINGLLVARLRVPSIMATLATQFFWYGVTVLIAGGLQINIEEIIPTTIHTLFVGRLFGVFPVQALWALGATVFLWFILNRHKFGEAIMFIGDNAEVARVMGINVEATRTWLFTFHGALAAFAGLLLTLGDQRVLPDPGTGNAPGGHGGRLHRRDVDRRGAGRAGGYLLRLLHHRLPGSRRGGDGDRGLLGAARGRAGDGGLGGPERDHRGRRRVGAVPGRAEMGRATGAIASRRTTSSRGRMTGSARRRRA